MNKKSIILLACFLTFIGCRAETKETNPMDFIDQMYYDASEDFAKEQAGIDRDRSELVTRKSHMQEDVYAIEKDKLDRRQKKLDGKEAEARKNSQQVANFGLNIAQSTFQGSIEKQKIDAAGEAKLNEIFATDEGKKERLQIFFQNFFQSSNLTKLVLATGAGMGLYYTEHFAHKYFEAKLGMPKLLRESSRMGVFQSWVSWLYKKPINQDEALSQIILAPEIQKKISSIAHATAAAHKKGLEYRNLLLYGEPGTGKTLIAQTIARSSNMDFAMMTGADFSSFKPGDDVKELHKVFDWAVNSKRDLILFIDEADAFLGDRSKDCSERRLNLISAYLARVITGSKKIMIILASNHPTRLDSAVRDRIDEEIEIPLPGLEERIKMLQLYIDTRLKQPQKDGCILSINNGINDLYIKNVAQKIDGFSGRAIYQLIAAIRIEGCITENEIVSKELFDRIVDDKIKQHQKKQQII